MSNVPPPPGGYPQQPQQPPYQPPPAPQPQYQQPQPQYQQPQPQYQQPQQFQPVNPVAAKSGNGCLKAFLIVMAISVVLGIAVTVFAVLVVGKAVDDFAKSVGVAEKSDYDLPTSEVKCEVDEVTNIMKASGTITNKRTVNQAYQVKVNFLDESGTKLDDASAFTGTLSANQKGAWEAIGIDAGSNKKVTCQVVEVDYSIFSSK